MTAPYETGCSHKWDFNLSGNPGTVSDSIGSITLTNDGCTSNHWLGTGSAYYLALGGSGSFYNNSSAISLSSDTYTIEMCLFVDYAQTAQEGYLFRVLTSESPLNGVECKWDHDAHTLNITSYSSGANYYSHDSSALADRTPLHLVFTRTGETGTFYINGTVSGSNYDLGESIGGSSTKFGVSLKGGFFLIRVWESAAVSLGDILTNTAAEKWRWQDSTVTMPVRDASADDVAVSSVQKSSIITMSVRNASADDVVLTSKGITTTMSVRNCVSDDVALTEVTRASTIAMTHPAVVADDATILCLIPDEDGAIAGAVEFLGGSFHDTGTTIYNAGTGGAGYDATAVNNDYLVMANGAKSWDLDEPGTDDVYYAYGTYSNLGTASMTMEFGINMDDVTSVVIFHKGPAAATGCIMGINASGQIYISRSCSTYGTKTHTATTTTLSADNYYYIVIDWDMSSTSNVPHIWISADGGALTSQSITSAGTIFGGWTSETTNNAHLGCLSSKASGMDGQLIFWKFHQYILSETDRNANFASSKWRTTATADQTWVQSVVPGCSADKATPTSVVDSSVIMTYPACVSDYASITLTRTALVPMTYPGGVATKAAPTMSWTGLIAASVPSSVASPQTVSAVIGQGVVMSCPGCVASKESLILTASSTVVASRPDTSAQVNAVTLTTARLVSLVALSAVSDVKTPSLVASSLSTLAVPGCVATINAVEALAKEGFLACFIDYITIHERAETEIQASERRSTTIFAAERSITKRALVKRSATKIIIAEREDELVVIAPCKKRMFVGA
jgi:hypothetical protein